jgi:hypothetical protein
MNTNQDYAVVSLSTLTIKHSTRLDAFEANELCTQLNSEWVGVDAFEIVMFPADELYPLLTPCIGIKSRRNLHWGLDDNGMGHSAWIETRVYGLAIVENGEWVVLQADLRKYEAVAQANAALDESGLEAYPVMVSHVDWKGNRTVLGVVQ